MERYSSEHNERLTSLLSTPAGHMNSPAPSAPIQPLRLLVVDDEPSIREVLTMYFTEDGHTVGTACDGEDGLQAFIHGEWDVVLTDRVMPHRTGDQLAAEIRKIDATIPIILVTGFADLASYAEGKSPFDRVVRKPFTRESLRAAISHAAHLLAAC